MTNYVLAHMTDSFRLNQQITSSVLSSRVSDGKETTLVRPNFPCQSRTTTSAKSGDLRPFSLRVCVCMCVRARVHGCVQAWAFGCVFACFFCVLLVVGLAKQAQRGHCNSEYGRLSGKPLTSSDPGVRLHTKKLAMAKTPEPKVQQPVCDLCAKMISKECPLCMD